MVTINITNLKNLEDKPKLVKKKRKTQGRVRTAALSVDHEKQNNINTLKTI